jgi:hypothetical protein
MKLGFVIVTVLIFIGDFRIMFFFFFFFFAFDSKSFVGFSLLRGHEKIIEYSGGLGLD